MYQMINSYDKFLFSLTNPSCKSIKHTIKKDYCSSSRGPTFGGGLYICSNSNSRTGSHSNTGERNFLTSEIEVFEVNKF
jgi:hypothetical protein